MQSQLTLEAAHLAREVARWYARLSKEWQLIDPRPPTDVEAVFHQRLISIQLCLPDVLY